MPIFEFVKAEKMKMAESLLYYGNKKFKCHFFKRNKYFETNYLDEDEKLILPVLNKISSTYQNYPERNRILSLKKYRIFIKQIKEYKNKSKKSIIKFEEFSSK